MDFLTDIFGSAMGFLGSGSVGTILGVVGGYITKREERKFIKEQGERDLALQAENNRHEKEMASINQEHAVLQSERVMSEKEWDAFIEGQSNSTPLSENIKAIVRPLVLVVLLFQTYLLLQMFDIEGVKLNELYTAEQIATLHQTVIYTILSLTCMAVSWYFTQRTSKSFDEALRRSILK